MSGADSPLAAFTDHFSSMMSCDEEGERSELLTMGSSASTPSASPFASPQLVPAAPHAALYRENSPLRNESSSSNQNQSSPPPRRQVSEVSLFYLPLHFV